MKQGDKIQPKIGVGVVEGVRTITYISDSHVLYRNERGMERHLPRDVFDERFEPVPTFFAPDTMYERTIRANGRGLETFWVTAVETNGDSSKVAFGRFQSLGKYAVWTTRTQHQYDNDGWRKL